MIRIVRYAVSFAALLLVAALAYGAWGYADALSEADGLALRADGLIADGRGGRQLGTGRERELLMVQDPGFEDHAGIDLTTPGAGMTTVTQSLAKRLAFVDFQPGVGKIRQSGYALGLEQKLTKDQIMALWLQTLEMGHGPRGWMTGFFEASQSLYGTSPSELNDTQFRSLVAVLIAPAAFNLQEPDDRLRDRIARIERLLEGTCRPDGVGDVWLEGCRAK